MAQLKGTIKNFILDADGVFNDGRFYYTSEGKVMKSYGADDSDALSLVRKHFTVQVVSGDKRGFSITHKRIAEDMNLPLDQVSTFDRLAWITERFNPEETIYMGDGIFDSLVFAGVAYGIAPANAFYKTREAADFVTQTRGGDGAVAEACFHIMETFRRPLDVTSETFTEGVGVWKR
ncbi:MAG: HAD hydrolase family protein [Candidatus Andersenbacteria bacterium]